VLASFGGVFGGSTALQPLQPMQLGNIFSTLNLNSEQDD
jgi:hypothetical protein